MSKELSSSHSDKSSDDSTPQNGDPQESAPGMLHTDGTAYMTGTHTVSQLQSGSGPYHPGALHGSAMATPRTVPEIQYLYTPSSPVLSTKCSTTRSASPVSYAYTKPISPFQPLELAKRFGTLGVGKLPPSSPPLPPTTNANDEVTKEDGTMENAKTEAMTEELEDPPVAEACVSDSEVAAGTPEIELDEADASDEETEWEMESNNSDELPDGCTDRILTYTLRVRFGIDIQDLSLPRETRGRLVDEFVQNLDYALSSLAAETPTSVTTDRSPSETPLHNVPPSQGNGQGGRKQDEDRKGKRKQDDFDTNQNWGENNGNDRTGSLPSSKKSKQSQKSSLRLSCPFRKRNPCRFNIRDFHSCSFTFFSSFSDLKQHLVGKDAKHLLEDAEFTCQRCNKRFPTRALLDAHCKAPEGWICPAREVDPEDGISSQKAGTILSRKQTSSRTTESQWRALWGILFPGDDEPKPHHFQAPIEHFEFAETYERDLHHLQDTLRGLGIDDIGLASIHLKFLDYFRSVMEHYKTHSTEMQYVNRQGSRRRLHRDSGVGMDDDAASTLQRGSSAPELASASNMAGQALNQQNIPGSNHPYRPIAMTGADLDPPLDIAQVSNFQGFDLSSFGMDFSSTLPPESQTQCNPLGMNSLGGHANVGFHDPGDLFSPISVAANVSGLGGVEPEAGNQEPHFSPEGPQGPPF